MVCGKTIYMKFQALLLQNSEFNSFIYSVMIGDLGLITIHSGWFVWFVVYHPNQQLRLVEMVS